MKKDFLNYDFPRDLKDMSLREMDLLSIQIREFLVDSISKTGGHLASNLGVVELTVALHKFFDTPKDKIIWDVGHQCYVHKILTGRADKFDNLRKIDGISGFPKTSESEFDVFDTGHSSCSISIATGFATARDMKGEDGEIIAVIGDGALTGGLAYEGLNNLGASKSKVIVILNDNGMSISKNTGGLSRHLSKVRVSKRYLGFKKHFGKVLKNLPGVGNRAYHGATRIRDKMKYSIVKGVMFEQLGFTYMGPIDGHNLEELMYNLKLAKAANDSVFLHVVTKKGKGYPMAERNSSNFHGVGPFDKTSGKVAKNIGAGKSYSSIFGNKLTDLAKKDENIVAVSAAMIEGTGLTTFERTFPNRTFDVGIAESHAVTFAGAMGKAGLIPVVAIYSTFLQRAYDNIINDVCLQNSHVIFAIDRAGNVGADGETHHGMFDISYLKNIPNLVSFSPISGGDLRGILEYAIKLNRPVAIRYPRGVDDNMDDREVVMDGKDRILFDGMNLEYDSNEGVSVKKHSKNGFEYEKKSVAIFALGNMAERALELKDVLKTENIRTTIVGVRCLSPIDSETLDAISQNHRHIVTMEDGVVEGGYGESIASHIINNDVDNKILNIGWPKAFIEHGDTDKVMARYGMGENGIVERIVKFIEKN